jgi:hypothetical protein
MVWTLCEDPRAELYTNPASLEMVRRYDHDVGAFEDDILKGK